MSKLFNVAEIEITYRPIWNPVDRVTQSEDAAKFLRNAWNDNKVALKEFFWVLLLNRGNYIIGISRVSEGSSSGTVADVKSIFQAALKANASSIILAHNHPSGNVRPSINDKTVTKKMVEAGKVMEIPVLDHIILSPFEEKYLSFADESLI